MKDIDIARAADLWPIEQVADALDIHQVNRYGEYKAKIPFKIYKDYELRPNAKLVLVTAMSPTPAGEGKTTITIGLADSLRSIGVKACAAIREPSLGPVFGMKGGAAGGGYAQAVPMEDLNLHFTGDMHAVTAANNLLAAIIDNHIYQGNSLGIDKVLFKRCLDMCDRQLRHITSGQGRKSGVEREDGFIITAASEVMAVLCLASDINDMKQRLSHIIVAYDVDDLPITAGDLNAQGAMAILLKEAFDPNLVQSMEHTPVLVHGGPFANIAHGCNSLIATRIGLKCSDVLVTEAGFGADLGAEKFIDIKCRTGDIYPDVAVLVCTVRALKYHGGVDKDMLSKPDTDAVRRGADNLVRHVHNLRQHFGLPVVVALNHFDADTSEEVEAIHLIALEHDVQFAVSDVWRSGSGGGRELAQCVMRSLEASPVTPQYLYDVNLSIQEKISKLAIDYYGAGDVKYSSTALVQIARIQRWGMEKLAVCMAKTQFSFSGSAKLRGAPDDFTLNIKEVALNAGAGFIVVRSGNILTLPGLPRQLAAADMDIDQTGNVVGLS